MEQIQEEEKHIIWSNLNLDLKDWREFLEEEYPGRTEDEYYYLMHELNDGYLDDERMNLDLRLSTPIIVCADLGLWNGRKSGYRMIGSGNIKDCLDSGFQDVEWYVDGMGDLRSTAIHHDGRNHYLYRAVKERVPDWKVERLQDKLYEGTASYADIAKVTRRLGDEIAAVYGFPIQEENKEIGGLTDMEVVDVQKEVLEEVELLGQIGYFTELRVDKETVPEGMHCYELRHGDDNGFPVSVEENVRVNYFGAVLLAEALELGNEKALQFGYDDFGYTGEQMYLSQVIGGQEPEIFKDGKALAEFFKETFPMTEEEGQKLVDYMEGHGYVLGNMDGGMFRGDLCDEQDKVTWEPYTIDDAVDAVTEWNFELINETEAAVTNPKDMIDFANQKSRLDSLREDEQILDKLFDRTSYGKMIEAVGTTLAEALIEDISRGGDIDAAVKNLTDQIKEGVDQQPDVSPEVKKNGGKSR